MIPTGIEKSIEASDFSIWPNPARDFINVYAPKSDDLHFEISNLKGSIVNISKLDIKQKNQDTFRIGLPSDLSQGQYHLKISTKTRTEVIPFLIER